MQYINCVIKCQKFIHLASEISLSYHITQLPLTFEINKALQVQNGKACHNCSWTTCMRCNSSKKTKVSCLAQTG